MTKTWSPGVAITIETASKCYQDLTYVISECTLMHFYFENQNRKFKSTLSARFPNHLVRTSIRITMEWSLFSALTELWNVFNTWNMPTLIVALRLYTFLYVYSAHAQSYIREVLTRAFIQKFFFLNFFFFNLKLARLKTKEIPFTSTCNNLFLSIV